MAKETKSVEDLLHLIVSHLYKITMSSEVKKSESNVVSTASVDQGELGKTIEVHDKATDDALAFATEHYVGTLTPEEDKRLLRKIDRVMMPMVSRYPSCHEFMFRNR